MSHVVSQARGEAAGPKAAESRSFRWDGASSRRRARERHLTHDILAGPGADLGYGVYSWSF